MTARLPYGHKRISLLMFMLIGVLHIYIYIYIYLFISICGLFQAFLAIFI
jgi:hypothetical protein